jgi:hypothetical protein
MDKLSKNEITQKWRGFSINEMTSTIGKGNRTNHVADANEIKEQSYKNNLNAVV